ncbi:uncharacterized protein LOC142338065 [Convolutriloba macropyga]|uniref:uncharacterized protein LOC142338065 n=1 Tax=Convolutriloba macropyga TaxID=536237 RepID=UPI003F520370
MFHPKRNPNAPQTYPNRSASASSISISRSIQASGPCGFLDDPYTQTCYQGVGGNGGMGCLCDSGVPLFKVDNNDQTLITLTILHAEYGWYKIVTKKGIRFPKRPDVLQELEMEFDIYPCGMLNDPYTQKCYKGVGGGDRSMGCLCDSGGPLYKVDNSDQAVCIAGILSTGAPLCKGGWNVFTKAEEYQQWISEHTGSVVSIWSVVENNIREN